MRRPPRQRLLVGLLAVTACVIPTDRGGELAVQVAVSDVQLLLGERTVLVPSVTGAAGGAGLNVAFTFASTDPAVASVDGLGTVLATGVGTAAIVVAARAFESATPDTVVVYVIDNVRFDAVRPDTVKFGEVITIVGSALDPSNLTLVAVGGVPASVVRFVPGAAGSPDTLQLVTPVGAAPASFVVALHERGASATAPITVVQDDVFEPNDSVPARIAGGFPLTLRELALESGRGRPVDWYRLGALAGSATVELRLGIGREFGLASVTLSSPVAERGDAPDWSVRALSLEWDAQRGAFVRGDDVEGPSVMHCRGLRAEYVRVGEFVNRDFRDEVVRIPLSEVALDSVDLTVELLGETEEPWSYELAVAPGYVSTFPPDAYEENDFCDVAPVLPAGAHALTLDDLYDVDWFRVRVEDVPHRLDVTARYRSDGSNIVDVDMMLYRDVVVGDPAAPDLLPVVVQSAEPRRSLAPTVFEFEAFAVTVPAGDYFLLVRNSFAYAVDDVMLTVSLTPEPGAAVAR